MVTKNKPKGGGREIIRERPDYIQLELKIVQKQEFLQNSELFSVT